MRRLLHQSDAIETFFGGGGGVGGGGGGLGGGDDLAEGRPSGVREVGFVFDAIGFAGFGAPDELALAAVDGGDLQDFEDGLVVVRVGAGEVFGEIGLAVLIEVAGAVAIGGAEVRLFPGVGH